MSAPLHYRSAAELSAALAAREISSAEIVQALIDRVARIDPRVRAFNSLDPDSALADARASDERRAAGTVRGALDGIPVGLKDVIAVEGQPLTASSRMLETFVSPYDATVTRRLRAAGAIPWGRLNLDEFAMGSST
ncbi:MAG: amidase family protein, partial [Opitutaceae bacterium]